MSVVGSSRSSGVAQLLLHIAVFWSGWGGLLFPLILCRALCRGKEFGCSVKLLLLSAVVPFGPCILRRSFSLASCLKSLNVLMGLLQQVQVLASSCNLFVNFGYKPGLAMACQFHLSFRITNVCSELCSAAAATELIQVIAACTPGVWIYLYFYSRVVTGTGNSALARAIRLLCWPMATTE